MQDVGGKPVGDHHNVALGVSGHLHSLGSTRVRDEMLGTFSAQSQNISLVDRNRRYRDLLWPLGVFHSNASFYVWSAYFIVNHSAGCSTKSQHFSVFMQTNGACFLGKFKQSVISEPRLQI